MKLFNKLTVAAVGVVLGLAAIPGEANAASFGKNMVINGEFEDTKVDDNDWLRTDAGNVSGWQTTDEDGEIELWNQSFNSVNGGKGSDGKDTGNHLETNLDGIATISQTFTLAEDFGQNAIFSFDAWSRKNGTGKVSVFGSESGSLLNEAISMNGTSWTENLFKLDVFAGEEITIAFQGNEADSIDSPHIDQVFFGANNDPKFVQAAVPEPASILGILAVGAFGSASTLKRKKKQQA
ncbi:PEP-CTERM putative exosortase interaction domain-containing protein [Rivularia sp. PCC 7116]|uniref:PEP-CTERM sorting domain-containing protein n=1 Tax=Rivularia sp. PCC 7116 TaxID=373994 RepID=UPI00029EF40F|nr:PEP-CTERM sorting domain-containing protein [Rivularia sp. PCC 7116]AFY56843.1 PEP-CTERM putative exosortase interaction domain-containing protein [Rivularia sp. PCC 7116]